jgi:hypothetical protein
MSILTISLGGAGNVKKPKDQGKDKDGKKSGFRLKGII